MKKSLKILLGIVIAVVVAVAAIVVWQWENISAIYMGITYDETKIEEKLKENKKILSDALEKDNVLNKDVIEGFTKEDEEKLAKGEITVEEAVENLFKEPEKEPERETEEVVQPQPVVQDTSAAYKTYVQEAVKEMYTIKAIFLQKLGSMEKMAKREYVASGEMTIETKLDILDRHMGELTATEKECNKKVDEVLADLTSKLKSIGADTSVVDVIRKQYNDEKQLQKSQYIKEYM